jgi:hypothetical protein
MTSIEIPKVVIIKKQLPVAKEHQLELDLLLPELIIVKEKPKDEIKRGILVTNLFGDEKI